ncbi:MAG: EAL domain-containing protein [Thiogranum sp.]
MQADPVHQLLGIILLIYTIGLVVIGHTHYRSIQRSLQLAIDNEQLVGQLTEANSSLKSEVRQKQRAMDELGQEKERAQVTLHSIGDGVITTDQRNRVLSMNAVAEQLTGWTTDEARGRPVTQVFQVEEGSASGPVSGERRSHNSGKLQNALGSQILYQRDGIRFYIKSSHSPIRSSDGSAFGSVIVFHDVTKQQEMAERLSYQASHDALTGLINRMEFERFVESSLQSAKKSGSRYCVCYADLDQFKIVNDTCGHVAGDELLRRLASGLPSLLRESDVFARLGGDEFGVLLEDCSLEDATELCERLRKYVREHRFVWDGKVFEVGVSIGIIEISSCCESVAGILSAADIACYAAKDMGRNQVHVYQRTDSESGRRHNELELVSKITRAIEGDRLVLFFQDIVATSGKGDFYLHGEVLVRMHDERGELIQPGLFLPAAERYNLMESIDLWVIRNTFAWWSKQCARHAGDRHGLVSINLSGSSLGSASFQDRVVELANEYNIVAGTICFEITETAAISNLESATRFMKRLRASGVKFALDDFGSGLSSFAYLKNLPVDYLKIDGSFVRDIADDPVDREMVRAIHQIGRVMGIETIAEFVENRNILRHLAEIGVDYAQGYGIARPKPIAEVDALHNLAASCI